jgi:hypothetical protein
LPPWRHLRAVWLWPTVGALCLVAGLWALLTGRRETSPDRQAQDAAELHAAYRQDPKAVLSRFAGQEVTVRGRVVGVHAGLTPGNPMILLGTVVDGDFGVFFISPADAHRAAARREVIVRGRLSPGESSTRFLFLEEADLLSAR